MQLLRYTSSPHYIEAVRRPTRTHGNELPPAIDITFYYVLLLFTAPPYCTLQSDSCDVANSIAYSLVEPLDPRDYVPHPYGDVRCAHQFIVFQEHIAVNIA